VVRSLLTVGTYIYSNTKLIGRPGPKASSFKISKIAAGHHLGFGPTGWRHKVWIHYPRGSLRHST